MQIIKIMYCMSNPHDNSAGKYLKSCDFEAHGGRGQATLTTNPAEAQRFKDSGALLAFWSTVSKTKPVREDGMPNRPMTAYTITLEDVT